MKWITRERPKIDRIACPWLIAKFIDRNAEFIYVAKDQVFSIAKEAGAIPYDIPGAELTHEGEFCSFDTFLKKYRLSDPALERMAIIVRAADTDRHELDPVAAGEGAVVVWVHTSSTFKNIGGFYEENQFSHCAIRIFRYGRQSFGVGKKLINESVQKRSEEIQLYCKDRR